MSNVVPNPLVELNNARNLPLLFPRASKDFIALNTRKAPAIVERRKKSALGKRNEAKEGNSGLYIVRVTSHRVRPLDDDNLCEKFHVDALRYAGILSGDSPDKARIVTTEKKVKKKSQEKTLIEIWQEKKLE